MKTKDLIGALVADGPPREMPVGRSLAIAAALGFAIAAGVFLASLGPRGDILAALNTWRFLTKLVVTSVLFAAAIELAYALAVPGRDTRRAAWALCLAPAVVFAAIAIEVAVIPSAAWPARAIGTNHFVCLVVVPLLSIPPLASLILALRHGAPTLPWAAGMAAGINAGAAAAFLYATQCPDDSPLFVAIWYTLAIAIVATLGAVAGRIWLRW